MDVVVFGAGSLGSLVGGLLAREHAVTLVGRADHVAAVRERGLQVEGVATFETHPAASTEPPDAAGLAVVTVKAFDTEPAAAALAECQLEACLSLQNGIGNEAVLADRLTCPVLAGTCTYGARLEGPGRVAYTGRGEVVLGNRRGGTSSLAATVGDAFARAGIQTTVAGDMPRRLWEKLAVNAGINPTTALADVDNGALADGPAGAIAHTAAREAAGVAREAGVDLADDDATAALDRVVAATAANASSMRQDVAAGRRTEVDAINGVVVDHASDPVPVNTALAGLVRAWEAGRGLRG